MNTLADLVARDRRSDGPALSTPGRVMDYRRFCTTTWKASNYLRHLGVGGGRGVAVLADGSPPPLLTFFGAALLDAPTRFVDDTSAIPEAIDAVDARAVLVPVGAEGAVDPPASTTLAVHGGEPTAATTGNWEEGVWSENPAFVPSSATPDSTALDTPDRTVSHGDLLAAGERITSALELGSEATVAVRGPLVDPRTVAGVVAALSVGGCARLGSVDTADAVVGGEGFDIDPFDR